MADSEPGGDQVGREQSGWLRDRPLAAAIGLGLLLLYGFTLCPTVSWYDSAEYATAAAVWGIPHPPGYPVYVLLAAAFALLPVSPALAANGLSAVAGALAAVALFAVVRRSGGSRTAAAMGALVLGVAPGVWANAVVAEAYTPALALLGLLYWLLLPGPGAALGSPSSARRACLAALLAGVGLGIHLSLATCGLGFAFLVWRSAKASGARAAPVYAGPVRTPLACAVMVVLGACVFLILPLRAAMSPPLNMLSPNTPERFLWLVTGGNYRSWFEASSLPTRGLELLGKLAAEWGAVGTALVIVGALVLARRQRPLLLAMLASALGNLVFFFGYRVHDIQVFLLPTVFIGAWSLALGADWLLQAARGRGPWPARGVTGLLAVGAVLVPLGLRYADMDRSHDVEAQAYGEELVRRLPPGAVIATYSTPEEWRYHAVFAHYYQTALGERPDVKVVTYLPPHLIGRLLSEGRPVFMYTEVPQLAGRVRLRREGPLYRVVGGGGP